jgi:hypothetical protein
MVRNQLGRASLQRALGKTSVQGRAGGAVGNVEGVYVTEAFLFMGNCG